jgi:hypothetical protein
MTFAIQLYIVQLQIKIIIIIIIYGITCNIIIGVYLNGGDKIV